MPRFTYRLAIALLAGLLAVLAGCASGDDQPGAGRPTDRVVYLTSFGNFGRDSYVWVARAKGFFAARGITVDIRPGTGTDVVKMIAAGKAHFGAADFSGGLIQASQNTLDIRAVALIHQHTLAAIMVPEAGDIRTPKDLEGRIVADLPASVVRLLFPTYARLAGIDADQVRWVNATTDNIMPMLASSRVDAIAQFVVGKPTVEAVAKQRVRLLPYSDYLTDLPGVALFTHTRTDPDLVARFRAALLDGLRYAIANPGEAGRILAAHIPAADPATAAAELALMAPYVGPDPGAIDPARIARAIALLQAAGAIPPNWTPDRILPATSRR